MDWRTRWRSAQGWSMTEQWDMDAELFRPYPPRCCVCGKEWRPDKPLYVYVMGMVCGLWEEDEDGNPTKSAFRHVWYSPGLNVIQDTGHLGNHPRALCLEHGDILFGVRDCLTGGEVGLLPPLSRGQQLWRDAKFWTLTFLRFLWGIVSDAILFAIHPVRAYRWIRYKRRLGL